MSREEFIFKGNEETNIYYYRWAKDNDKSVKGVILILHGMAEHALRYANFANFLNENNYIVYAVDHRGHGKTGVTMGKMGYFGKGGWDQVVNDTYQLLNIVKSENKGMPIIMFGHSMGSIITRTCVSKFGSELDGVVLSGTTNGVNLITRKIGLLIAKSIAYFFKEDKESPVLNFIFFNNYNKRFKNGHSVFDWLSRDQNQVQKYLDDKLCGFICTSSFYAQMMSGINENAKKTNLLKVDSSLPMLIFSGTMDPVGGFGRDVIKTHDLYKDVSKMKNIKLKLYEEGRHEMLNELNKDEVYQDILKWLEDILNKKNLRRRN